MPVIGQYNALAVLVGLVVVVVAVLGLFSIAPFSATIVFALLLLIGAGLLLSGRVAPP